MIQNYFVGAKLTRSDIKSQSSCINRDRNEFGSRESVVFVVKKYWPPTFNFTQFSVPCFFRTLGLLLRVFILTVVILFLHFCFILLSLYFVIKYKVISKIFLLKQPQQYISRVTRKKTLPSPYKTQTLVTCISSVFCFVAKNTLPFIYLYAIYMMGRSASFLINILLFLKLCVVFFCEILILF